MPSFPSIRRLALILALLPQLLILGFGQGMVLCVTEDGHFQVEVPSDDCCEGTSNLGEDQVVAKASSDSDCGACDDFLIVFDSALNQGNLLSNVLLEGSSRLLVEPFVLPEWNASSTSPWNADAKSLAPLHLGQLRSVLLLC